MVVLCDSLLRRRKLGLHDLHFGLGLLPLCQQRGGILYERVVFNLLLVDYLRLLLNGIFLLADLSAKLVDERVSFLLFCEFLLDIDGQCVFLLLQGLHLPRSDLDLLNQALSLLQLLIELRCEYLVLLLRLGDL